MSFTSYVDHGWKLCPIRDGEKRPRGKTWNTAANALTRTQAGYVTAAGLMHAYSGTCALDIDSIDLSRAHLAPLGVDLDALLAAPDAVRIDSGTIGRAKLLYSLPIPLTTKKVVRDKIVTLFELRCGDSHGGSVQDLLPPSPHPSGRTYEWKYGDDLAGDWRQLPPLPPQLLKLWQDMIGTTEPSLPLEPREPVTEAQAGAVADAEAVLAGISSSCDYDTWMRLGMALEHDLGEVGWQMWHDWSATSEKFPGTHALEEKWTSFNGSRSANPVTLGSFKRELVASVDEFEDLGEPDASFDPEAIEAETRAARAASIKLWTYGEIMERPWPEWTILDVLPRAEINMLYGESGAGKSFIALDMASAIVRGVPWFNHDTEQGNVLWLAAEAFGSMKPRLKAHAQSVGIHDLPGFYVKEGLNLADVDSVKAICEAVKHIELKVVIVDTLAAATGGANENSGEDMGKILDTCRMIYHTTHASVLLVHHEGKNALLGARGWSGIKAAVQAELRVEFDQELGQRTFTATKQRDGEPGLAYGFALSSVMVGADNKGRDINSAFVKCLGKIEAAPVVRDGSGRRPPVGQEMRMALDIARETIGIAADASSQDLRAAIMDVMAPPGEGERETRGPRAAKLIDKLVAANYLRQTGGRVSLVEDAPEATANTQVLHATLSDIWPGANDEDDLSGL